MSQIDTSSARMATEVLPGNAAAGDQQRGWNRSLESEGWRAILDTMHNFPGVSGLNVSEVETMSRSVFLLNSASQVTQNEATSSVQAESKIPASAGTAMEAIGKDRAAAVDRSAYAMSAAPFAIEGNQEEQGGPELRKAARSMAEENLVAPRKVLVLPSSEHGVEVWVRDARITGAQMQMLLADIRRNIQAQGGEISRVSVNGRQVDSERLERIESEQTNKQAKGD